MFIIVLGQHASILIESSSGPCKNTDPYLAMFKMRCEIPNAYILDKTMYKMHVLLCSYYTIRILISKTLTGTCEGGYTYVPVKVLEISILIVHSGAKRTHFLKIIVTFLFSI